MDTQIGILQYIKSGEIEIDYEISNIKAHKNVNIRIQRFLSNSPDFQQLYAEILRKKKQLEEATDTARKDHLEQELNNLQQLEQSFKIDVLHMARIFSRLKPRTERLQKAMLLFDEGKFKEADRILCEVALSSDQFDLLTQADYLEEIEEYLINKSI